MDTEHLIAIGTAVRAREVLRFDYATRDAGPDAEPAPPRRVEPHHLVTWGGRWYLVAWDLDRDDWRTFRVDRMTPRTPTGPRFTPRAAGAGRGELHRRAVPAGGHAAVPGRGDPARAGRGHRPLGPRRGVVEELGPDRCRVVAGSWSWIGLAAWMGMFDVDLEIVGPPELRAAAATLAARYGRPEAGPA